MTVGDNEGTEDQGQYKWWEQEFPQQTHHVGFGSGNITGKTLGCPPLSLPRRWQMRASPQVRNTEKLRCCIQGIKKLNEIACRGKDINKNKDLHKELDRENPQSK